MNVSVSSRPLILGIGNPLRSDDGLGWVVAEQLAQAGDQDWETLTVHQLTPDLAQRMATARLVVMIDATRAGEPGDVRIRSLSSPAQQPGAIGTHHTTPEELVGFTKAVYGHCPPVVVMTVTGADFSVGEQISPAVEQKIALASTAVRQICASFPIRLL